MEEKKEFDFEKAYEDLLTRADEVGMSDDVIFQTLMKEFKRMKNICDKLYAGIEQDGVSFIGEGSMGQEVYKSNPLVKDYVSAHKTLVSTCGELNKLLANVSGRNNDDDELPY